MDRKRREQIPAAEEHQVFRLQLVTEVSQVRSNTQRFNRDAAHHAERARLLLRETHFWVYDPDTDGFGPSKFCGFRSMAFNIYETALGESTVGDPFDGHLTRKEIEQVVGQSYGPDHAMAVRLRRWAERLFDTSIFEGIEEAKWQFLALPQGVSYWAFFANPQIYDIESALAELTEDTWTVKGSDVHEGDRVLIWQGLKDGQRGAVALGEVVSDPQVMPPTELSRRFLRGKELDKPERRVWVRYLKPPALPLWLNDDESGTLQRLTVARSRGGTVFRMAPAEWHDVLTVLGKQEKAVDIKEALDESRRELLRIGRGQGFQIDPIARKAIEVHSMRLAEEHFLREGFFVEDVSKNKPYDLVCTSGDVELHVEVKGTLSAGNEVMLTPNEVDHARNEPGKAVLFVVHSLNLCRDAAGVRLEGGEVKVLRPWQVGDGSLRPNGYTYTLPK